MTRFARTIHDLEKKATVWWPDYLLDREARMSVVPLLIQTQDVFINILRLCGKFPEQVFDVLLASGFQVNLFLKHLVVLADFGGEQIQRLNTNLHSLFDKKDSFPIMEYMWNGRKYTYHFKGLPVKGLNNKRLGIDGEGIGKDIPLNDTIKDTIMILLYGSSVLDPKTAEVLIKCEIGNLIGRTDELENFIRQRYICVSRITGGAQANTLGQIAQAHVTEILRDKLGESFFVDTNGHIEGVSHNDDTLTTFDIVVSKNDKSVAVEVSFQVTTNSTIERKAGQAKGRYERIKKTGNYIAYVIDGAGNFQRKSAISIICSYSDCTVAFSDNEFNILIEFIKEKLK